MNLDTADKLAWQRRNWIFERFGWALLVRFEFAWDGTSPVPVSLELKPLRAGPLNGILGSDGRQVTTFDFVLLLIVAETTQQALLGQDFSITNALLLIVTLVALDIGLSLLKQLSPRLDRLLEGLSLVIVENGRPLRDRMAKARVDDEDIMSAARELRGIEQMDRIKYDVLERNGSISIIERPD